MAQHFTLGDGRSLDYAVGGAPKGFPLVWFHGTPSSYPPIPALEAACKDKDLSLITFSRPGYGDSTRQKGRRVVDAVTDVRELLDHLGYERCLVGGWSGGGPHALACGARLQGCIAVVAVAPVAPYDGEGLDFLAGQGEDNVEEFGFALKGEPELQTYCQSQREGLVNVDGAGIVAALAGLLPPVDKKAILGDSDFGSSVSLTMKEGLKHNSDGWVDDDMAFISGWGFDVDEIKCPVFLYQGSEDIMVPYSHGLWLGAHVPERYLTSHLEQGEGHISIFFGRENGMLDELLAELQKVK